MKILVMGSGGREHALAWKIAESPRKPVVYLHPGNAGTARAGFSPFPVPSTATREDLAQKAKELQISLVVIGPEMLLADGMADYLRSQGFLVVGPSQFAAQLETSKVFAKDFMKTAGIPTAAYWVADTEDDLRQGLKERADWPVVLKLDGLAAGKGVVVAEHLSEAIEFCDRIYHRHEFGNQPHRVVVEDFIRGSELSYIGLCDGETFLSLASATDFKRVGDGQTGPNTGGMGSVSPSPYYTPPLAALIHEKIIHPMLKQFQRVPMDYRGALYVGVMIDSNGEPRVLEFNARFGDPETQALLLRLKSDFIELLEHTARGTLKLCPKPQWKEETSVYVVAAAEGYPGKISTGDRIEGAEASPEGTQVFYSGVTEQSGHLVTGGGRVLGIGALGHGAVEARKVVYSALKNIHFRGMHYRMDIGA
jgi:phosphoribosylamine---glycine ligase